MFLKHESLYHLFRSGEVEKLLKSENFMNPICPELSVEKRTKFIQLFPQEFEKSIARANNFLQNKFSP